MLEDVSLSKRDIIAAKNRKVSFIGYIIIFLGLYLRFKRITNKF